MNFFKINPTEILYRITAQYKSEGNVLSCHIPVLDLSFTAVNEEEMRRVAEAMISAFLDYWIEQHSIHRFSIELKKLGFVVEKEPTVMFSLRNNRRVKAEFAKVIDINDPSYKNVVVEGKSAA